VLVLTPLVAFGFVGRGWAKSHGTPLQAELLANLKRLGIGPEARFAGGHGGVATGADLERQNTC